MKMNKLVLAFVFSLPAYALATEKDTGDADRTVTYSAANIDCHYYTSSTYTDYYVREIILQDFISVGKIKRNNLVKISKTKDSTNLITLCLSPRDVSIAVMAKLYSFPVTINSKSISSGLLMSLVVNYDGSLFDNAKHLRDK